MDDLDPIKYMVRWSTRVLKPNDISIGSAVLQGSLLWQTDRPTDRPRGWLVGWSLTSPFQHKYGYIRDETDHATRSVTIGHMYVRSTALRPNNNRKQ